MPKTTRLIWGLLLLLCTLAGIFFITLFSQPYSQARSLIDQISKDGSMDSFTTAFYAAARMPLLALGAGLILSAVLMIIFRSRVFGWIAALLTLPGRLWDDLRALLADLRAVRLSRPEWAALGGLTLVALAARVPFLMRPYYHDEAYTVVTFAIQPFHALIADYSMPNNHIFHTILVRLAYLAFDIQPWAMRLPALIAGLLCVPAIYFLARKLYNPTTAALAAAAVAAIPVLVNYSTASRGYTLVMLFSILTFILALYIRQNANLAAWAGLIICSTLGLYTVPVFLAPFGGVMLWLFLTLLAKDFSPAYTFKRFLGWLLAAGVCTVIFTGLLYAPIFLRTGLKTDFTPAIVNRMSWELFSIIARSRIDTHIAEVHSELPPAVGWLTGLGFILSLAFAVFPKYSPGFPALKIPTQPGMLGFTIGLYTLLRVPPEARIIVFLAPYWLMWASAGWTGLFQLASRASGRRKLTPIVVSVVILIAVLGTGWRVFHHPEANVHYRGHIEETAVFLQTQMRDMDLIVVNNPNDAATWYYSRLHGIHPDHYKRELPFFRAFVLVDSQYQQTLASVLEERGPEPFFLDFTTARVVYQSGTIQVVEIIPFEDLIRSEYHLP